MLKNDGLPEFNNFTVEKCTAAISKTSYEFETEVKNFANPDVIVKNVFTDIIKPLEHIISPLEMIWGIAKTLYMGNSAIMPTKQYMHIHKRAHQAHCSRFNSLPIYKAVIQARKEETSLTEEENRVLRKFELEGRLNGLSLNDGDQKRFKHILFRIDKEQWEYREKNRLALQQFRHTIKNPEIVRDFPNSLLKAMSTDSNEPSRGPWIVTHQPFVYDGFMEYCPDRMLRWNAWQARIQLCSVFGEKSVDTGINVGEIRGMRNEKANILGFKSFIDMSMKTKMAGSAANIDKLLTTLLERARPYQDVELEHLEDFTKERDFSGPIEYWDIPYWSRKQKNSLYQFDEENIREYFPLPVVVQGLFDLCSKLFDIKIVEQSKVDVWHEDVKFYQIFSSDSASPIAGFYFDPYSREKNKLQFNQNTGWMLTLRNRSNITGSIPLGSLIFNFEAPLYGKPSLLSFTEVSTLFQKFGHGLRHLLTETNYSDVSGLSNVEWDTVGVTGHVMTHWLYEPFVIQAISSHYATQEPLPTEIVQNLDRVRKHMAGYQLCKELYLSKLDLEFHQSDEHWRDIIKDLWPKYHSLPRDKYDSHPCHFTKIMCEEWGGAYYCDIWSRMLAADIYGAFHEVKHDENNIMEVGLRFRDTYLTSGGACDPAELFRRFRGRDPSHKALLHTLGLKKPAINSTSN